MPKGKVILEEEGALILQYRKEGKTGMEIANLTGRPYKSIKTYLYRHPVKEESVPEVQTVPRREQPMVQKTLSDWSPREIFKHLYNLGYRIEDNKIVCYRRHVVNLEDIINS